MIHQATHAEKTKGKKSFNLCTVLGLMST